MATIFVGWPPVKSAFKDALRGFVRADRGFPRTCFRRDALLRVRHSIPRTQAASGLGNFRTARTRSLRKKAVSGASERNPYAGHSKETRAKGRCRPLGKKAFEEKMGRTPGVEGTRSLELVPQVLSAVLSTASLFGEDAIAPWDGPGGEGKTGLLRPAPQGVQALLA